MLNQAEKNSIGRAREYLIKHGICARDGSGEPDVEGLFTRIYRQNGEYKILDETHKALLKEIESTLTDMKHTYTYHSYRLGKYIQQGKESDETNQSSRAQAGREQ